LVNVYSRRETLFLEALTLFVLFISKVHTLDSNEKINQQQSLYLNK